MALFELEVDAEWDDAFTAYCFFQDLHNIQDTLKRWTKYKDGELDLISATIATQAGIELVHRAEKDLLETNPDLRIWEKPYEDISMAVFYSEALRNGRDPVESLNSTDSREVTPLDKFIYLPTARSLINMAQMCEHLSKLGWPLPVPPMRFSYIARPELLELPKYQKLEKEDATLTRLMLYVLLEYQTKGLQEKYGGPKLLPAFEDESTKSMRDIWTKCEVNIRNVFAPRVLLDILGVCDYHLQFHQNLLDMGQQAKKTFSFTLHDDGALDTGEVRWLAKDNELILDTWGLLEHHITYKALGQMKKETLASQGTLSRRSMTMGELPPEWRERLREEGMLEESPEEHKENMRRLDPQMIRPAPQPDFIISHNPLRRATLALKVALLREATGLALADHHLSIFAAAHLHNALRQLEAVPARSWPQIEHAMELHKAALFANDVPHHARGHAVPHALPPGRVWPPDQERRQAREMEAAGLRVIRGPAKVLGER